VALSRSGPPRLLVAGTVAVLALVVVGNLATGWRGRDEQDVPVVTTLPPRPLEEMVSGADEVFVGRVVDARRIGELRDPAVVAVVQVETPLLGQLASGATVRVYDRGFVDPWRVGDRALLFVGTARAEAKDAGAAWRVQHRFSYRSDRLDAPFTLDDVRREIG
jgi:hypothetical protein